MVERSYPDAVSWCAISYTLVHASEIQVATDIQNDGWTDCHRRTDVRTEVNYVTIYI